MNYGYKFFIYTSIMFLLSCGSDEIVQYFEYPDHNVLNIGSQLTDLVVTSDSNTLIAADKGNNQVRFIDVSTDEMSIISNVWVGSEPTSLELTADGDHLLVGLQGASSVAILSVAEMELLGTILLDDDGVYDIEYINTTNQLIVSFVASNPTYNKTKLYDLFYYYNEFEICSCSGLDGSDCVGEAGGCMDNTACNYDANATIDDGTCERYDCAGVCGGSSVYTWCDDSCGESGPVKDCDNKCDGTADYDECGDCVGGETGLDACVEDCAGEWGGSVVIDECGWCGGDGSTCAGEVTGCMDATACNYDANATIDDGSCAYELDCGDVCGGSSLDTWCNTTLCEESGLVYDECGECGGPGILEDQCDCAGNVLDCAGECGGSAIEDCAGRCNSFDWPSYIATPSTVQVGNNTVVLEDDYAGFISISDDEEFVYIIDRFGGIDRVYKYKISGDWLSPESYSAVVGVISSFHDIEYIPDFGIVVAIEGMDALGEENLDHSPVYDSNHLSHIASFGVGSTPLALAYDAIDEHIYISPTDVDDNGMFIIEYNIQTQLQTNYYQVAGRLGSHALVVDQKGEYIYAAVDDLSDQDTDEPYNDSSFNIQRIKIMPEGTYDAINNFE